MSESGEIAKATAKEEADSLRGIACSGRAALAAPYAAGGVFVALPLVAGWERVADVREGQRQRQRKKQIPFGNDKQREAVLVWG